MTNFMIHHHWSDCLSSREKKKPSNRNGCSGFEAYDDLITLAPEDAIGVIGDT